MKTFDKISDIRFYIEDLHKQGKRVGFIPTMGALHEGHISLVKRSVNENDITIVSIFVNPIQFNNKTDLEKYPRDLKKDISLIESAGVDVVFVPSVEEMYPEPVTTIYDLGELSTVMEGASRPGHFNGVAIVVHKLFNIINPDNAYFGEKDYQQVLIIKYLVKKYNIPVNIVVCPISREDDGLARSSRNARLTPEMRLAAPFIYAQLKKARQLAETMTAEQVEYEIKDAFTKHQLLKLEYFTVANGDSLTPVNGKITENSYGFITVLAGDVRLIDNIRLI